MTLPAEIFSAKYKLRRAREYSRARRCIYNMTISDKMCVPYGKSSNRPALRGRSL